MVAEISDSNFQQEILESDSPVLVDFWASWCGPCKMLAPILDQVAEKMQGKVKIVKMNIEENPNIPSQFGVRSIPTLMMFNAGKQVGVKVGVLQQDQLTTWINSCI